MTHPLDSIAAVLDGTGLYWVLRRLEPWANKPEVPTEPTFTGLIVDVETTGLDLTGDEVIELGMLKFEYGASGRIYRVLDTFSQLQEPSRPIPPEITRLVGFTEADVAGQRIDDSAVQAFAADATLVIAHNARFDRPMCERRWPVFAEKNWACSCDQIPWRAEGHEGTKLGYLLMDRGYFHSGHRALDDCHAVLRLLASPLRTSRRLALSCLLKVASQPTLRLWAQGSPIAANGLLKARRYRWSGTRRCWYIDVDEDQIEAERRLLAEQVYCHVVPELRTERFTATDRFSERTNPVAI